jgi:F0F1-type ATP synthase beta subunit
LPELSVTIVLAVPTELSVGKGLTFEDLETKTEVFETGIKVIDLLICTLGSAALAADGGGVMTLVWI